MLWSIIVGGFIGLAAGAITKKGGSMGIIANIFAGLIGSSVGQSLFGTWGSFSSGNVTYSIDCWCGDCCRCSIILFG